MENFFFCAVLYQGKRLDRSNCFNHLRSISTICYKPNLYVQHVISKTEINNWLIDWLIKTLHLGPNHRSIESPEIGLLLDFSLEGVPEEVFLFFSIFTTGVKRNTMHGENNWSWKRRNYLWELSSLQNLYVSEVRQSLFSS